MVSPTKELNDATLTSGKSIQILLQSIIKKCCLSMHYSGENTYLLLMVQKFINSKLNLNVVSKGFSADNMRKTGFYGPVYDFSVDHNATAVDGILDIHRYLTKEHGTV